jgi:two-component system nitrogen regulation response regulator GlnG
VVTDIRLSGTSGLDLLRELQAIDSRVPVILMTGHGTASTAIDAMRRGAFEYLLKPLDLDLLEAVINRALETSRMSRTPAKIADENDFDGEGDLLVGQCPAMQEVYRQIGRVAGQDVTVLILGESGTGKEVVARSIYQYSNRADRLFLAINCAAIPEQLLESELFGHEKGSFTGAERKRIGKFEQCDGGTLFLDEIGDMTPLMQTKVLRVLQDQQFERVGGNEMVRTNVRLIAATNRNLTEMMEKGTFRADLYYRLNVYTIQLPPLRERDGDLQLLVNYFLKRFNRELGKSVTHISPKR